MDWDAFFTLHSDLPREGPGDRDSLDWALSLAGVPHDGAICDAGCGPGDDIAGLLAHVPDGTVEALDLYDGFVAQAARRFITDPRVTVRQGDMGALSGPYDLIWSAGAVYFLGVTEALTAWRTVLAPGGAVAFSQACWFTDRPSDAARAYWEREYPQMTDIAGVNAQIAAAGYDVVGQRPLSDAAWEAYFTPLEARIAELRPGASAALAAVLDENEAEIATWRAHRAEYGYLLSVVRPA
ncbi:class I SAM-dependent methyltransferase [Rhodovulum adriaticum]|uniref:Trans-aconitate methyltransferase n=1 Tax=Rhodovulum adriaticum TaxID=35804 RepID=A0A4R2NXG5_RHOAD|nr:class I SAM-dependent methyltransferase [Rhodovulum adriaticum]MBK1635657.1 methyltransferase type 12 [Rhodovulum adriaticum]TCP26105.1 trans-aconitate methyltransferase [Rhodovulum adriaticum]